MNRGKGWLGILALGSALWLMMGAQGCAPSIATVCNKACDCQKESCEQNGGVDACIDSLQEQRDIAKGAGCGDQYDDLLSCYNEELECTDGQPSVDGCETASEDFNTCVNGGGGLPVIGNACEAAINGILARYEACGIEVVDSGEDMPECTGALAQQYTCFQACIEAAPCDVFTGASSEGIDEYSDCISGCES